jgi:pathogenesis-related protein 1
MKWVLFLFLLFNSDFLLADLKSEWLAAHNEVRKEVGVPPLKWDEKRLQRFAEAWTDYLAKEHKCQLVHSKDGYGENLAATWGYGGKPKTPKEVVAMWYKEKQWYNYKKNKSTNGKPVGHYTQLVWRNSKFVACAKSKCENGWVYSCNYDPPGNFRGQKPY